MGPNMGFGLPVLRLNESPSEKEGKCEAKRGTGLDYICLNESPSEKEGKSSYSYCTELRKRPQ